MEVRGSSSALPVDGWSVAVEVDGWLVAVEVVGWSVALSIEVDGVTSTGVSLNWDRASLSGYGILSAFSNVSAKLWISTDFFKLWLKVIS